MKICPRCKDRFALLSPFRGICGRCIVDIRLRGLAWPAKDGK